MPKRFTDTDKWKKPFIKKMPPHLKLLWFYILDDCDIAGLWQVDIDIAELRIGCKIDVHEALNVFADAVVLIDNGEKWFIPSFLEFQYGNKLSKTNNIYKSIERILNKYDLYKFLNIEITEEGTTISSFRNRISSKLRDAIFLESEFTCQYCSEQKPKSELVIDHFIPLNKGGDNSDGNLVCSCGRCNSHKTDLLPDIFLNKGHSFLKPSQKIFDLLQAYKKLEGAYKPLQGAKDKDKEKDKEMDKEKDPAKNNLSELEISKTKEFIYYSIGKNISDEAVLKFWKAFLIHSDGKTYLKDSDKITHFRNWLKTQDFAEKPNTVPVENKPKTLKDRYLSPLLREGITLNEWEAEYDRLRPNLEAVDLTFINQSYIRGEPKWKKAVLQELFKR